MADRFELEQQLLSCWNIIEDLKDIDESQQYNLIESLVNIYNFKYEKMFDTFEQCIKSEFTYRKQLVDLKNDHEEELRELKKQHDEDIMALKREMDMNHYTGSF